ncbi:rRNA (cytosine-C5-)-methyltransferase RCM1 KNAG_0H02000 [Huiozyma naganishii CBS 8797]|uniref:SAM-dependent MTase RsmB/NOP-type domain-containing protein n=1 Tax=Huiozyma naganishii (strain ATCC MYA-139 / BCRC 22969 / CBS 8797 / KCTC 17520 / NBRC 10181 / NCYC 3082 / Yp74L-3) TaxID=1071383 RepID=J7S8L1_HUIN7|nr:hypothetical protein KNAG_0H02000 [Kazachstania naganishii CBS 8797]CCK71614.1 hypothetical protein KNAG_0H02000 [Kazachstania naganishii CBS 8797]
MDFYRDATWVLESIENQDAKGKLSGSLQTLVLNSCKRFKVKTNPKHIYAVVSSCWRYKPFLEKVMKKSKILDEVPQKKGAPVFQRLTLLLLCHDLLLSKSKRIQMGKHPIKMFVLKYKTRLNAELAKMKVKLKVKDLSQLTDSDDLTNDITPVRWFRVNPLRCTAEKPVQSVVTELRKKFTEKVDSWKDVVPGSIYYDEYIPNLFCVHPQDKITSHELYKQGKIIIQDRASCFPAHILNPKSDDIVIDACAAPGNKTTHLAAHMFQDKTADEKPKVQIYAFEKDPERAQVLNKMIKIAGCSKEIEVIVGDFTKLATPQACPNVNGLIVDPSCSGSGIFGRKYIDSINHKKTDEEKEEEERELDAVPEEQEEQELDDNLKTRLSKLSSFQFQIVKYALSFPQATKVVYSTCSIHAEENERVVIDLLLDKKVKESGWRVAPRSKVIPTWERRGLVDEFQQVFREDSESSNCQEMADGCIRALPREDGGIGFFAVCFERTL